MHRVKTILLVLINNLFILSQLVYASDNLDNPSSMGTSVFLGILKFIIYILLFIAVIFLTLYGTKYIAKNMNRLANSKYIDNIDAISLSNNTQVNILKIDKFIYIVLVSEGNNILLDKILETEFSYERIKSINSNLNINMDNEVLNSIKKFISKEDKNEKGN